MGYNAVYNHKVIVLLYVTLHKMHHEPHKPANTQHTALCYSTQDAPRTIQKSQHSTCNTPPLGYVVVGKSALLLLPVIKVTHDSCDVIPLLCLYHSFVTHLFLLLVFLTMTTPFPIFILSPQGLHSTDNLQAYSL